MRFVGCWIAAFGLLLCGGANSPVALGRCQTTIGVPVDAKPPEDASATTSVEQLFENLQSEKFQVRENATKELVERGAMVLPEIAKRYFSAPPETVYRIRKILEGVGSSGDEQTFLRATSLLLTLYSNGNQEMGERIERLKADWRKRRKEEAVKVIVASGGKVVSAFNTQPQLRQALVFRRERSALSFQSEENEAAKPRKLDVDQQKEVVAKIMANSAEDNRDFILENAQTKNSQQPNVLQYTSRPTQPVSIQFPKGWVATEEVLSKLGELDGPVALELHATEMNNNHWREIKNLAPIISVDLDAVELPESATTAFPIDVRAIKLSNYSLDPTFCKSLGQFSSLGVLQLSNCKLNTESVSALNQLKRVSTIPVSFEDTKVDAQSISWLAKLKRVRAIAMRNVQVSTAGVSELEKLPQISSLKLSSMSIDKEFLESVGRMKRLAQLELRGCEFDIAAFRRLESTRRVRIDFQPKAFLGVGPQGGGRSDQVGCQIAYIAPGSAAASAGISVGDVIRAIDGDPVKTFHEVRLRIAQYDPGEKMAMKVQRGDKELEINVELGKNSASDR